MRVLLRDSAIVNVFPRNTLFALVFVLKMLQGGSGVGLLVGAFVGATVGCVVGATVGATVGCFVGATVGAPVGAEVSSPTQYLYVSEAPLKTQKPPS